MFSSEQIDALQTLLLTLRQDEEVDRTQIKLLEKRQNARRENIAYVQLMLLQIAVHVCDVGGGELPHPKPKQPKQPKPKPKPKQPSDDLVSHELPPAVFQLVERCEEKALPILDELLATAALAGVETHEMQFLQWVESARDSLTENNRNITASADAVLAMRRAVAAFPPHEPDNQIYEKVVSAENHVRDLAVWRCQLSAIQTNKRTDFVTSMAEAFGLALEDKNLYSRLLHSHRHAVEEPLREAGCLTFLSNSQQAAIKHGRTRPRNRKNREQRHAAVSEVAAAPEAWPPTIDHNGGWTNVRSTQFWNSC